MTIYDELQAEASELLAEFGQGSVVLSRTTTTPDPSAPWEPGTPSTTTYPLDAVVSGVASKYVDGTLIKASDLMITAAVHAEVTPQMGDAVSIDGGVAKAIKRIEPMPAAGTPAAFMIFVEG